MIESSSEAHPIHSGQQAIPFTRSVGYTLSLRTVGQDSSLQLELKAPCKSGILVLSKSANVIPCLSCFFHLLLRTVRCTFTVRTVGPTFSLRTMGHTFLKVGHSFIQRTIGPTFSLMTMGYCFTLRTVGYTCTHRTVGHTFIQRTMEPTFVLGTAHTLKNSGA